MLALIVWMSILGYLMAGAFVAGRTYMYFRLRDVDLEDPGPAFTIAWAFFFWWAHLVFIFSIWSGKKGLVGSENWGLLKEKEQAKRRERIAKLETENMKELGSPDFPRNPAKRSRPSGW